MHHTAVDRGSNSGFTHYWSPEPPPEGRFLLLRKGQLWTQHTASRLATAAYPIYHTNAGRRTAGNYASRVICSFAPSFCLSYLHHGYRDS